MAAPGQIVPQTPHGVKFLDEGFSTTIVFAANPTIAFKERDVKPGGYDGGEPIDNTTMRNTKWHTMAPRTLIKSDPFSANVTYDTLLHKHAQALVNVRTSVTCWFPDGSNVSFYGYLQKIEFSDLKEGELPTAAITVIPTNYDPINRVEQGPVWTDEAGTGS
jgi:hypothetical protein